ncbi:UNVERIFIED_CONTAM: hypothetical protein FKN15_039975 [Acipenser sinensis]
MHLKKACGSCTESKSPNTVPVETPTRKDKVEGDQPKNFLIRLFIPVYGFYLASFRLNPPSPAPEERTALNVHTPSVSLVMPTYTPISALPTLTWSSDPGTGT